MTMKKHGAEAHFVRPDGVYRTSVLQAIPGYQPVSNAYNVAARFTTGPYFAMQLNGLSDAQLTPMQKIRLRWEAWKARMHARRVGALTARVAASTNMPTKPPGMDVAAIPTAAANAPIAVDYGAAPARENMAKVGAQITAGLIQNGEQALPAPPMAQTEFERANLIDPNMAAVPGQMAAMMQAGVPVFVGDQAYQAAMARWQGMRNWWWWNLS
jgi:hypothetical protein